MLLWSARYWKYSDSKSGLPSGFCSPVLLLKKSRVSNAFSTVSPPVPESKTPIGNVVLGDCAIDVVAINNMQTGKTIFLINK